MAGEGFVPKVYQLYRTTDIQLENINQIKLCALVLHSLGICIPHFLYTTAYLSHIGGRKDSWWGSRCHS